jgi:hypothetical protein
MPRKVLPPVKDTLDVQKVQQYIEERSLMGNHYQLDAILRDSSLLTIQPPLLRPRDKFEIKTYAHKVASVCQLRGKLAESPCNNCAEGKGPFAKCVFLEGHDDITKKCCGNCQFKLLTTSSQGRTPCSFSEGTFDFLQCSLCWNQCSYRNLFKVVVLLSSANQNHRTVNNM